MSGLRDSIDSAYDFVNGAIDAYEKKIGRAIGHRDIRGGGTATVRGPSRTQVARAPRGWTVTEVTDGTTGQTVYVVAHTHETARAECTTRELADKIRALLEVAS